MAPKTVHRPELSLLERLPGRCPRSSFRLVSRRLRNSAVAGAAAIFLILPAAAQAEWGAIAINERSGRTSISYDYETAAGARARAKAECGRGCHAAVWVQDGFAVLVRMSNGDYKAGLDGTRSLALAMARRRAGEPYAPLHAWVFSG